MRVNKYTLLAIMLIAVFLLPSCRTRITNNSEVSNIQYDEDGFLSETYEMRREELGLSTAERPILPDFGSAEDDNDDFSEGETINYNPDDYQEDFPETQPSTNTNTNTGTNRSGSSGSSRSRYSPGRRSSDDDKNIVVILDLNDGSDKVLGSISVKEGGTYEDLPKKNPKHSKNYKFLGWFTEKKGGTQVKADTKVTEKNNHTLYAHWEEPTGEPEKKEFNVTIKYNIEGQADKTETVKKGASYRFPLPGEREGYDFDGWKVGGKTYKAGSELKINTDVTVEAQWKPKAEAESEYIISVDPDGGSASVSEDKSKAGKYKLPAAATKEGYNFEGWEVGGKLYAAGDEIDVTSNTSIKAKWSETAETHWSNEFKKAKSDAEKSTKPLCYTLSGDDTKIIQDCYVDVKKEEPGEDYKYVIKFASSKDVSETLKGLANEKDDEGNAKYEGKTIIVISKDANKNKYKLAYQIALMNIIHNSGIDKGQAIADLLGQDEEISIEYKEL